MPALGSDSIATLNTAAPPAAVNVSTSFASSQDARDASPPTVGLATIEVAKPGMYTFTRPALKLAPAVKSSETAEPGVVDDEDGVTVVKPAA